MLNRNRVAPSRDPFAIPFSIVPKFARSFADEDPGAGGAGGVDNDPVPPVDDPPAVDPDKDRLISESIKYRKRAQEAERQLESIRGKALSDEDIEKFETLKAQEAEAEKANLEKKGEYDKLIAKKDAEAAEKIAAKDTESKNLRSLLEQTAVNDKLKSALADAGAINVDQAAFFISSKGRAQMRLAEDGSSFDVVAVDEDGDVMLDPTTGKSVGLDVLAKEFLAKNTHFLRASGDVGTGAHNNGAKSSKLDELKTLGKSGFIEKYGQPAYMQVRQIENKSKSQGD